MSLGVFVGGQVLAELCSLGVPLSMMPLSLMRLWVWTAARFGRAVGQENDDHRMGYAFNAFYFNEVCFPFFTPVSWLFAEVVIGFGGFWGRAALSETLSQISIYASVPGVIKAGKMLWLLRLAGFGNAWHSNSTTGHAWVQELGKCLLHPWVNLSGSIGIVQDDGGITI